MMTCVSQPENERAQRVAIEVEGIARLLFDRIIQPVKGIQYAVYRMIDISDGFRSID